MARADRIPKSSTINKVVLNKALRSLTLNLKAERWDQMFSWFRSVSQSINLIYLANRERYAVVVVVGTGERLSPAGSNSAWGFILQEYVR